MQFDVQFDVLFDEVLDVVFNVILDVVFEVVFEVAVDVALDVVVSDLALNLALEEEEEPDFTAVEVLLVVLSNMSYQTRTLSMSAPKLSAFFLKSCQWQYIVMFNSFMRLGLGCYDCMSMLSYLCFVQSLEFGFERVCSCLASGHILDSAVL